MLKTRPISFLKSHQVINYQCDRYFTKSHSSISKSNYCCQGAKAPRLSQAVSHLFDLFVKKPTFHKKLDFLTFHYFYFLNRSRF